MVQAEGPSAAKKCVSAHVVAFIQRSINVLLLLVIRTT